MKKVYLLAIATAAVLVGCSSNDVVNDIPGSKTREVPIGFSVQKQNITRAATTNNLETVKHYNFGVFAWKVNGKNSLKDQEVMNNYLVGFGGTNVGYDHANATTWENVPGTVENHTSPWFYEGLGTAEYTNAATGFYQPTQSDYMSKNANQYLRYWDLSYDKTNFYCYAPYNKNVTFDFDKKIVDIPANTVRDGYDNPLNEQYKNYDRSLSEFMYAGKQATNASLNDVTVSFKHMGAQLSICFYEEIPGYRVQIIELDGDNGTLKDGLTNGYATEGIQATPAIKSNDSYSLGSYYTKSAATIDFSSSITDPTVKTDFGTEKATSVSTPLMFKIPAEGLEDYHGYKVIKAKGADGVPQCNYSPTIYYPIAQKDGSTTGFTFHISYRIIAEDNQEVVRVHNATVHVPYEDASGNKITVWQANTKYTYTFKFTTGTTGSTDYSVPIDPNDPKANDKKGLYPIVFDECTIEDFTTESSTEYVVSDNTSY